VTHPKPGIKGRAFQQPVDRHHGFCASLDEAKAKFAETWRAWLALS